MSVLLKLKAELLFLAGAIGVVTTLVLMSA